MNDVHEEAFRMKALEGAAYTGSTRVALRRGHYDGSFDTAEMSSAAFDTTTRRYTRITQRFLNKDGEFIREWFPGMHMLDADRSDFLPRLRVECFFNKDSQLTDYSQFSEITSWGESQLPNDSLEEHLRFTYNADGNLTGEWSGSDLFSSWTYLHDQTGRVTRSRCTRVRAEDGRFEQQEYHFLYSPEHGLIGYDTYWRRTLDTASPFLLTDLSATHREFYNKQGKLDSTQSTHGVIVNDVVIFRRGRDYRKEIRRYDYKRTSDSEEVEYWFKADRLTCMQTHRFDQSMRADYSYDDIGREVESLSSALIADAAGKRRWKPMNQVLYFYGDAQDKVTAQRSLMLHPERW